MKLRLFWKIYLSIAICSAALVWGLSFLDEWVERKMSYLADGDQQVLQAYADQARFLLDNDPSALHEWGESVKRKEQTWLAVMKIDHNWLYGSDMPTELQGHLELGRAIYHPIHLNHRVNPMMGIPLGINNQYFLIQLPQHMRPGKHWQFIHLLITLMLPILLVAALSYLIYCHVIKPLASLHEDSQRFSGGDFCRRSSTDLVSRDDEIGQLALSFNHMADNISALINSQRQLIADISHELRTPMTRLRLLLDSHRDKRDTLDRIDREVVYMTGLVEDTLTLAWLDNEKPELNSEEVNLVALIEIIAEDARFEFPNHQLITELPEQCWLVDSHHRAIGQSIENIVRNAMKYSPVGTEVMIRCRLDGDIVTVEVLDQGPGVPADKLNDIFQPFVRIDKARGRESGGYGLGLALSKRHLIAIGGSLTAKNRQPHGLLVTIKLPRASTVEHG